MRTVGEILKEAREAKLYSLEDVEKATKIRKELLIALESDDYSKLPPPTFVQGFIKKYSKFLGLDANKLLAIYRREFSEKKHLPYIMDAFIKPVPVRKIQLTPGRVLGLVVTVIVISFFAYLWLQYRQFVGPPNLQVSSPQDQSTTDNGVITISGKTDPEVKILVNNQEIPTSSDGTFREDITLSSQVNKVSIVASSKFGQKNEIDKTVYFKK